MIRIMLIASQVCKHPSFCSVSVSQSPPSPSPPRNIALLRHFWTHADHLLQSSHPPLPYDRRRTQGLSFARAFSPLSLRLRPYGAVTDRLVGENETRTRLKHREPTLYRDGLSKLTLTMCAAVTSLIYHHPAANDYPSV